MTLEEVFKYVKAKEAGKHLATRLTQAQGVAMALGAYCNQKGVPIKKQEVQKDLPKDTDFEKHARSVI